MPFFSTSTKQSSRVLPESGDGPSQGRLLRPEAPWTSSDSTVCTTAEVLQNFGLLGLTRLTQKSLRGKLPAYRLLQPGNLRLHWQLCPYDSYKSERTLRVEFDLSVCFDSITICDVQSLQQPRAMHLGDPSGELQSSLSRELQLTCVLCNRLCDYGTAFSSFLSPIVVLFVLRYIHGISAG